MERQRWFTWRRLLAGIGMLVAGTVLLALVAWQWVFAGYRSGTLVHAGVKRAYGFYLPTSHSPARKSPLVFVLHGTTMTGRLMAYVTAPDLRPRAGASHAILVYPTAIAGSWNDLMGQGPSSVGAPDDVGFIAGLIACFVADFNADPDRVYLIGMSQGGEMALRLACDQPERLAGVAALISSMGEKAARESAGATPLPVFLLNGTKDEIVKWDGGPVQVGTNPPLAVLLGAEENLAYWTNRNRVTAGPRVTALPDLAAKDGSTVIRHDFTGAADVVFLKVDGGDHSVPITRSALWVTPTNNRDTDAIQLAFDFLLQFRRDGDRILKGLP